LFELLIAQTRLAPCTSIHEPSWTVLVVTMNPVTHGALGHRQRAGHGRNAMSPSDRQHSSQTDPIDGSFLAT
jgi:hypothetical protein